MKIKNYILGLIASAAVLVGCDKEDSKDNGGGKIQKPVTEIAKISYQSGSLVSVLGQVVAASNQGFVISDKTGHLYVYGYDYNAVVGNTYLVDGTMDKYGSVIELKNATLTASAAQIQPLAPTFRALDAQSLEAILASKDLLKSEPVELSGYLVIDGKYVNIFVKGTDKQGSLKLDASEVTEFNGKQVKVKGFVTGNATRLDIMPVSIENDPDAVPFIAKLSPENLDFTAAGGEKSVAVEMTSSEDVTVEAAADNSHFTTAVEGANVKVTAPQATKEEKGTLTVSLKKGGNVIDTRTVVLYQSAPLADGQLEVSIDFTTKGYTNANSVSEVKEGAITVALSSAKWFDNGTAVRVYSSGTLAVSGGIITKVKFYFGSSDGENEITADSGTFADGIWTEGATPVEKVTFTVGGSSGNRRITKIDVVYKPSAGGSAPEGGEGEDNEEGGTTPPAGGETTPSYAHTFNANDFYSTDGGVFSSLTLTEKAWSFAATFSPAAGEDETYYFGNNSLSSKGAQIGKGTVPASSIKLSTEAFTGTIKSIKINTSGASEIDAKLNVKVGDSAFGTEATLTKDSTDYTFTGSATGKIEITWTNSSEKAIYVKYVEIVCE